MRPLPVFLTMQISDILTSERVACDVKAMSKKRALQKLSDLLASSAPSLSSSKVFDCLLAREKLGSTGLGRGVAIPHARIDHGNQAIGAFIRMSQGVDYDAVDHKPVDLLFALLVPEDSTDEHLQILAGLAEMFSDDTFRERLRNCKGSGEIYDLIAKWGAAS